MVYHTLQDELNGSSLTEQSVHNHEMTIRPSLQVTNVSGQNRTSSLRVKQ